MRKVSLTKIVAAQLIVGKVGSNLYSRILDMSYAGASHESIAVATGIQSSSLVGPTIDAWLYKDKSGEKKLEVLSVKKFDDMHKNIAKMLCERIGSEACDRLMMIHDFSTNFSEAASIIGGGATEQEASFIMYTIGVVNPRNLVYTRVYDWNSNDSDDNALEEVE